VRRFLIAVLCLVASGHAAYADSDGYYCIGPNYLAVEFRGALSAGSPAAAAHVVKIARLDASGPRWAGELVLEDFQTHGMTCGADVVTIAGWRDDYVIALDVNLTPRLRAHTKRNGPPAARRMLNLGNWARQGVTPIAVNGGALRFQLRIARSDRPVEGGLQHRITSNLDRLDASGNATRSLQLFDGGYFEPVH
jgi:hypothetical protein